LREDFISKIPLSIGSDSPKQGKSALIRVHPRSVSSFFLLTTA
jgi:hypothetical protein